MRASAGSGGAGRAGQAADVADGQRSAHPRVGAKCARAGLGFSLALAAVIRVWNGDLPGALAALQQAIAQQHADGNLLGHEVTLRIAALLLAQLGEAGPAAVLAGAVSTHFPASISSVPEDERIAIDEVQALARDALGEAAYSAAIGRGAAMDNDQVVGYALGEFRRIATLLAEPGTQTPEPPQASRGR